MKKLILTILMIGVIVFVPGRFNGNTITANPLATPDQSQPRTVTVWLHHSDWDAGLASLVNNADIVGTASPAWYHPNPDGTIRPIPDAHIDDKNLAKILREKRIVLRPRITNVTPEGSKPEWVRDVLSDSSWRTLHIQSIATLMSRMNYHSIDIDYEGLVIMSERKYLTLFIEELAAELAKSKRTFSVTLEPMLGQAILPLWERIGKAADEVQLMVYSEHNSRTQSGPISSLPWSTARLEHALRVIPVEKLSYGMPLFAHAWTKGKIRSGSWQALVQPVVLRGNQVRHDQYNNPSVQEGDIVVWFEDTKSVTGKLAMIRERHIGRISLSRSGGEDPGIWSALRSFR